MKKLLKFAIALMILLLAGCASMLDSTPKWISSTYDSVLPEGKYLCAVGSGASRQDALNNAMATMAQAFSVSVNSIQTLKSSSTAATDSAGSAAYSDSAVMTDDSTLASNISEILGLEIHDTYQDKDSVYWVRVSLDRDKAMKLYGSKVSELLDSCDSLILEARTADNPLSGLVSLSKAETVAARIDDFYSQMRIISGKNYSSKTPEIETVRKGIVSSMTFAVDVKCNDEQAASLLKAAIGSVLSEAGIPVSDSGNCTIAADCTITPIKMDGSPYSYCSYSASLSVSAFGKNVFSWQNSKRSAGLSDSAARSKAVESAVSDAVQALSQKAQ